MLAAFIVGSSSSLLGPETLGEHDGITFPHAGYTIYTVALQNGVAWTSFFLGFPFPLLGFQN